MQSLPRCITIKFLAHNTHRESQHNQHQSHWLALQNAGAVLLNRCPDISVQSTGFAGNKAKKEGAALEMNNATGPVFNCTFFKNKVTSAACKGRVNNVTYDCSGG